MLLMLQLKVHLETCTWIPLTERQFRFKIMGDHTVNSGELIVDTYLACFVFITICMGNVINANKKSDNSLKLFRAFLGVTPFPSTNPPPLILDDVAQDYWQEWFLNGNGRITNAAVLHQLDITASEFKPGTLVGLFRDTGNPNQEWEIENIAKDKSFQ